MALKDIIRNVNKNVSVSSSLEDFLIYKKNSPSNRENGWHVSAFAGACPRAILISKVIGEDSFDVSPQLQKIFDVGTALHEWYQDRYLGPMGVLWGRWVCTRCRKLVWGFMPKEKCNCVDNYEGSCGNICARNSNSRDDLFNNQEKRGGCIHCSIWGRWHYGEVPVKLGSKRLSTPIVGCSDGLINLGGEWAVLEIKTRKEPAFQYTNKATNNHEAQAKIYGHLIKTGRVRNLPSNIKQPVPTKAIVMYIGKNTSEEKEFTYRLDSEEGERLISVPFIVDEFKERGELPQRLEGCTKKSDTRAKRCDFRKYCFDVGTLNLSEYVK